MKHAFAREIVVCLGSISLWFHADAVSLRSATCFPACIPERGHCIEGRCFCRSPFGGTHCETSADGTTEDDSGDDVSDVHKDGGVVDPTPESSFVDSDLDRFGVASELADEMHKEPDHDAIGADALRVEFGNLRDQRSTLYRKEDFRATDDIQSARVVLGDHAMAVGGPSRPVDRASPHLRIPMHTSTLPATTVDTANADIEQKSLWRALWQSIVGIAKSSALNGRDVRNIGGIPDTRRSREEQHTVHVERRQRDRLKTRPLLFASSVAMSTLVDTKRGGKNADPEACVPWLAELRSQDLYKFAPHGVVQDMKAGRLRFFQARLGGSQGLSLQSFLSSLPNWYRGPSTAEATTLFNRLDVSGDGTLDFAEYNWENLCGFRGTLLSVLAAKQKGLSHGFSILDKNQDGRLQENEFVSQSSGKLLGLSTNDTIRIFNLLDVGASPGNITRKEFERLGGLPRLRSQVQKKEPDDNDAFKQADTNNDGNLDQSEFSQHAQGMGDFKSTSAVNATLQQIDTNNDGIVAKDEYVNTCWRETGAICNGVTASCDEWRGPVFCAAQRSGACTCAPGYCAKNGACIPEELHSSSDSPLGPTAGGVLARMQGISMNHLFEKYLGGKSKVNAAESVVGGLFVVAILMQLKFAFLAFPWVGVVCFMGSVIAFTIVTLTCLRAFSVPNSIGNDFQVLLLLLIFCAIATSTTSLSRLLSPAQSKLPLVCWFVTDDKDEYGLNRCEAAKVRIFNRMLQITMCGCVFGLMEAPLDIGKNENTRSYLIMLYFFIVVLDAQLLEVELTSVSAMRQKCELHLKQHRVGPGLTHTKFCKLDCLAAWWNELCTDVELSENEYLTAEQKQRLGKSESPLKRSMAFKVHRTAWEDDAKLPEPKQSRPRSMPPNSYQNEMLFIGTDHSYACYVYGKVVVMWEDTDLEFAHPDKDVSEGQVWDTDDKAFPGLRKKRVTEDNDSIPQSIQEKMWLVTQAGASGLVVGQRSAGQLSANKFNLRPMLPTRKFLWLRGAYKVKSRENVQTSEDFTRDFYGWWSKDAWREFVMGNETSKTALGCAINTFLVGCCDMQDLEWALHERSQDLRSTAECQSAKRGVMPGIEPITPVICADYAQRRCEPGEVQTGIASALVAFDDAKRIEEDEKKNFRKVYVHQRSILCKVSSDPEKPMAFLGKIRKWVEDFPLVNNKVWPYIHLLLTFLVLLFVLWVAWLMYYRLRVNNRGFWAYICVLLVTLVVGTNISIKIDWWPLKPFQDLTPSLGMVLTSLVLTTYVVLAIWFFIYYAVTKGSTSALFVKS